MGKIGRFLLVCVLLALPGVAVAQQPTIGGDGWTLVLVPSFETEAGTHNLSVAGLNHSLLFGQTLASLSSGRARQIRQILAFQDQPDDLAPLQSVQPFALVNNLGVKVQTAGPGDRSTYGTAAYRLGQILANDPPGIYVVAASRQTVEGLVQGLTGTQVSLERQGQYVVVSGPSDHLAAGVYADGVVADPRFPEIPSLPHGACPQQPVTITVKAPAGLKVRRALSVYFIRHVEAHPTSDFENGNYVCQGQWRALGAGAALTRILGGHKPDLIISSNPQNLTDCGAACSYIRPLLTVTPFAIQHRMPVTLAPFQWTDATDLAYWLFDRTTPYKTPVKDGDRILVGWEHAHIVKTVKAILASVYKDEAAAARLPDWSFQDYDTVWKLTTNDKGDLTFSNGCEGIASAKLPALCPAFFPR